MRDGTVSLAIAALLLPLVSYAGQQESGPRRLPGHDPIAALRRSVFSLEVGRARLQDGKDCLKDAGFPCEWAIELTRAEQWGTNRRFLLVVVNANHLLGSGAWDSVFVYVRQRDAYVPVFSDRFLYGGNVELGLDSDFWLTAGVWQPSDPTCCPSSERRSHYMWNAQQKGFAVIESGTRSLKTPD